MKSVSVHDVPSHAQLIDVRERGEYSIVHAAQAVNIPLSELTTQYGQIDPDRDVYVICQAGGRSAKACAYLETQGREVVNVEGGTGGWIAEGRDVVEG